MIYLFKSKTHLKSELESIFSCNITYSKMEHIRDNLLSFASNKLLQKLASPEPTILQDLSYYFLFKSSQNLSIDIIGLKEPFIRDHFSDIEKIISPYQSSYDFFEKNRISILSVYLSKLVNTDDFKSFLYSIYNINTDNEKAIFDRSLFYIMTMMSFSTEFSNSQLLKYSHYFNRISIDDFNDYDFSEIEYKIQKNHKMYFDDLVIDRDFSLDYFLVKNGDDAYTLYYKKRVPTEMFLLTESDEFLISGTLDEVRYYVITNRPTMQGYSRGLFKSLLLEAEENYHNSILKNLFESGDINLLTKIQEYLMIKLQDNPILD